MAEIEIYTSPFCGFCHAAKKLLEKKGVAYTEIDVMMKSDKRREMTKRPFLAKSRHKGPYS